MGLRDLVERTLVEVRLSAGIPERRERIVVADFIAEVQVAAVIEAAVRDLQFTVAPIEEGLAVEGDRQILAAAVANVLQNAVKFTQPRGSVSLNAYSVADRIVIGVEDECGGLPDGNVEEIFRPFEQLGSERTGLGLGLSIISLGRPHYSGDSTDARGASRYRTVRNAMDRPHERTERPGRSSRMSEANRRIVSGLAASREQSPLARPSSPFVSRPGAPG